MNSNLRKKSPRAPSIPLHEAIDRVLKIYDKERRHPAPIDVIAQDIGYKNANSGAALSALASLRYYGLLERAKDGVLAVVKDVEDYKFAPDERLKQELVRKWLKAPMLFAELLDQYKGGLPSDGNIKFDLIQRGFNPSSADSCISVFRESVEYARYYEHPNSLASEQIEHIDQVLESPKKPVDESKQIKEEVEISQEDYDRIPVRLPRGRRAWLHIPSPFYEGDKVRLKAQIDLILTDDDGDDLA